MSFGMVHSTPRLLDTVSADSSGRVSASVTVPVDAPVGEHTLRLSGRDSAGASVTEELGLTVVASWTLPATGVDLQVPMIAALLLLFGLVAVVAARRPVGAN